MITKQNILLIAELVWKSKSKSKSTIYTAFGLLFLLLFSLLLNFKKYNTTINTTQTQTKQIRQLWEAMPDKHPHRMAHYGYIVLRQQHPLSVFDSGLNSYLGNAIFLEAHKQNSVNLSQASFSNGLLRFGEMSTGLILQILLPLTLFFWGFNLVSNEKENGTLKILIAQGANFKEIIFGKSLGLFYLSLLLLIPIFITMLLILFFCPNTSNTLDLYVSYFTLSISYLIFIAIICLLAVLVSAIVKKSKTALIFLISVWLLFALILPKIAQVISQNIYPTISKIEFDTIVEKELLKYGDSHNPNDPYFKSLKDSLLRVYKVDSIIQLPFNYGGYQMREGERISAKAYEIEQSKILKLFKKQQNIIAYSAAINPLLAIKNISIALTRTDFKNYIAFQKESEKYRYSLAQKMNNLQMKYISNLAKNSADKTAIVSKTYWKEFPYFKFDHITFLNTIQNEIFSIFSLIFWLIGLIVFVVFFENKIKMF